MRGSDKGLQEAPLLARTDGCVPAIRDMFTGTGDKLADVCLLHLQDVGDLAVGVIERFTQNIRGTIVGQARVPGGKSTEPVVWKKPDRSKNNAPEVLGICCAGIAKAVSQQGQIGGDTYDTEGRYHAFLWAGVGRTRRLGLPSEQFSSVLALNDLGQVVLRSDPAGLFLYQAGKRQQLELPQSQPLALNNHGVIVGSYGAKPEEQRAFVWDRARSRHDLNPLISPDSTWTLEVASSINDRGEIVGWGEHNHTENAGFLLIPQ